MVAIFLKERNRIVVVAGNGRSKILVTALAQVVDVHVEDTFSLSKLLILCQLANLLLSLRSQITILHTLAALNWRCAHVTTGHIISIRCSCLSSLHIYI